MKFTQIVKPVYNLELTHEESIDLAQAMRDLTYCACADEAVERWQAIFVYLRDSISEGTKAYSPVSTGE